MTTTRGIGKKGPAMAPPEFDAMLAGVSKAALIDSLWCACQLGTDESIEQISSQAARNVQIAMDARGDRVPKLVIRAAAVPIDSDPE